MSGVLPPLLSLFGGGGRNSRADGGRHPHSPKWWNRWQQKKSELKKRERRGATARSGNVQRDCQDSVANAATILDWEFHGEITTP